MSVNFGTGAIDEKFSRNFLGGKIFQKLLIGEKFCRNLWLGRQVNIFQKFEDSKN